jgi:hypothetical protein
MNVNNVIILRFAKGLLKSLAAAKTIYQSTKTDR